MVQASPIPNHLSCSSYLWPSAHQNKKEKMVDSTERRKFLVLWVISYNFLCCECFAVSEENSFLIVLYASHLLHLSIPLFTVLPLNMLWQTFIFVACHSTYFYVRVADFFFPVFLFSPCVLVFLFVHKSLYTMPMLKQIIPYASVPFGFLCYALLHITFTTSICTIKFTEMNSTNYKMSWTIAMAVCVCAGWLYYSAWVLFAIPSENLAKYFIYLFIYDDECQQFYYLCE